MSHRVLIVGAGFAGLGTAIRLKQAGLDGPDDFVILERADRVGGTWRDNTYPGAACDIPSLLYSYSFAPNPDWSRAYSGSAEIQAYIERVVRQYQLEPHIRLGAEVTGLAFDDATATWTARTSSGDSVTATHAVLAPGALANAALPDIRGIDDYTGKVMHSARWDHDYDLAGKSVAVIGTGASAVQIIPELVKVAGKVKVFQRTPGWVLPRLDFPHPSWAKDLFRRRPAIQAAARGAWFAGHEAVALGLVWDSAATTLVQAAAKQHLRAQVKDRWLRRQLTPDFRAGCKRMLVSSDYYPALQAANCKLVTWPIARLSAHGIRTAEGIEHRADAIVFATGFQVNKTATPFPVTGSGGRELGREWAGGAQAYKSVSVAGYPNLFLTFGPNSGPGHNSALFYLEAQIDYIVRAIELCGRRRIRTLDVRPAVQRVFNERLQRRLGSTTWNSGCRSWYLTADGYNATMFPGFATQYRRQLATVDLSDYNTVTESTSAESTRESAQVARAG